MYFPVVFACNALRSFKGSLVQLSAMPGFLTTIGDDTSSADREKVTNGSAWTPNEKFYGFHPGPSFS